MNIEIKYIDLLRKYNGGSHKHGDRQLIDHLVGTYSLLKDWNVLEEVCLAGLFHSVYGTEFHSQAAAGIDQRNVVKSVIGIRAEFLAYVFCVCRRFDVFANLEQSSFSVPTRDGSSQIFLEAADLIDLLVLEAANLTEQTKYFEYLSPNTAKKYVATYEKAKPFLPEVVNIAMGSFFNNRHPNPLVRPAMYGNLEELQAKIAEGCSVNDSQSDERAATALMYAVVYSQLGAAEILLQNGADIEIPDKYGNLPLKVANTNKDQSMIALLAKFSHEETKSS